MRVLILLILIAAWGLFLSVFVPGSLYSGTVIGALIATLCFLLFGRKRRNGNKAN